MVGEDFAKLGEVFQFVGDAGLALFDPIEEKLGGTAADSRRGGVEVKGGGGGEAEGAFFVGNGAEEEPSAGLQFYGGL